MSSSKVIDIFNTLTFLSDGITTGTNKITIDTGGILTLFNTTASKYSSVGALVIQNGGLSINNFVNATSVSNGGALTVAGGAAISGDLIVGGSIYYSNAAAASSTFAYLTLTATDQSINIANGALVVFGGISVQSTGDATSTTSGGGMTIAGGLAVNSSLYIGGTSNLTNTLATNITTNNIRATNSLYTNTTIGILNVTGITAQNINFTGSLYQNGSVYISSQWTTFGTNGNLAYTAGNVGINTTSPTFKLDVNGSIRVSGTLGSINLISSNTPTDILQIQNTNISGSSTLQFLNSSGGNKASFGIGNSNSTSFQNTVYLNSVVGVPINFVAGNNINNPFILNAADNSISITTTTNAVDTSSGSLKVSGGASFRGDVYIGGALNVNSPYTVNINNSTASSNSTIGAMKLIGGLSISITDTTNSNATSYTSGGGATIKGGVAISQDVYIGGILDIQSGSNNINPIKLQSIQISSNYNNGSSTVIQSGNSARTSLSFTPIAFSGLNDQTNPKLTINTNTIDIFNAVNAKNNSNTLGNLFTTNGNVGINTTSPNYTLDINGNLGISGSSLNLNNGTSNILIYNPVGVNPPTFTTRSVGTKLVLYNNLSAISMDYTIGIETNNMWFTSNIGFKWYTNNTSAALILNANGTVLNGNGNAISYSAINNSGSFDLSLAPLSGNFSTSALAGDTVLRTSPGHNLILQTNGGGAANIIINSSGNVGINTSNPTFTLDVSGTTRITGNLSIINFGSNVGLNNNTLFLKSNGNFDHFIANGVNLPISNYSVDGTVVAGNNGGALSYQNVANGGAAGQIAKLTWNSNGVGINNTSPVFSLDVNGTSRITTSLTTGAVYSTNATITNIVSTFITTSSILATNLSTTNFTTSNSNVTNSSISNLNALNVLITNLTTSNSNVTNASISNLNALNVSTTNFTTSNSNATNASISNLNALNVLITNFTTSNSNVTNASISNLNALNVLITNFTTSNSNATNSSTQNLNALNVSTTNLTTSNSNVTNLIVSNSTITNVIHTNITTTSIIITGGSLNATFNINTLGNLFTNNGNVGINTVIPQNALDVIGQIRTLNLTPLVGQNDMIRFGQTESNFNMALIDYNYTTVGSSSNSIGLGFFGANNKLVILANGNIGINNTSPVFSLDVNGTSRITTSLTTGAVYSTNATITNIVSTLITSSSILTTNISTTNFTTSNSNVTNASISNLNALNVSTTNFTTSNSNVTNLNTINLVANNSTITNIIHTNITTNTIVITGGSLNATFNTNTLGNLFTTGGNIGINTTSPQFALDIRNTSANVQLNLQTSLSQLQFFSTNTSNINYIQSSGDINFTAIGSSSVRTLYLATSGNVGIGNTNPNFTLDVSGTSRISTSLTTGSVFSTNSTITNMVSSTFTTGSIFVSNVNVSGNITVGGNLVVLGTLTSVNVTSVNIIDNNITTTSIIITGGSLNATFNSNTLGNLYTTGGNIGINTTSPNYTLDINGNIGISGSSLNLNNGTSNIIIYNPVGVNSPTFTTRSIGTKLVLYSQITSTNLDYAIGIENNSIWMSSQALFKFYTSNSLTAALTISANGLGFNGNGNNSSYSINNSSGGFDLALPAASGSYSTSALAGDTVLRTTPGHNLILQTNGGGAANIIINSSGNVGINTSNPTFTLDVSGTSRITTSLTTGAVYSTNATITNIVSTFITSSSILTGNVSTTNFTTSNSNVTNSSISNLNAINLATSNFTTSNSNVTNSSISNLNALNVSTTNFTTSNSNVTNSSISNLNALNVSTTNFTTSNSNVTNSSISNLNALNVSTTNFTTSNSNVTNSTITNIVSTAITSTNGLFTGISSSNSSFTNTNITNSSIQSLISTISTISNLISGNSTISNLITSNLNTLNLVSNNSTISNLNISGNITVGGNLIVLGTLTSVNVTSVNIIDNNITTTSIIITGGSLNATFNINTLGNLFTNNGNVGINTVTPQNALDVIGQIRTLNLTPLVGQNDMIRFGQTESNFNMALIDYNYTTVGSSSNSIGLGFFGANNKLVVLANGNIGINNTVPSFTLDVNGSSRITTSLTTGAVYSTNATITNIVSTFITSSSILTGNVSTTNFTTSNSNVTNSSISNLNALNISTTNFTTSNSNVTNSSISNLNTNKVITASILITGGSLNATFNSNTLGNLYTTGGNIGINNINPTRTFVVSSTNTQGSISITNTGDSRYHLYNGGVMTEWLFGQKTTLRNDFTITSLVSGIEKDYFTILTTGNVGINTTSPNFTLDVSGTTRITTSLTTGAVYSTNATITNAFITTLSTGTLSVSTLSVNSLFITGGSLNATFNTNTLGNLFTTNGNIGINTTSPNYTLDINGTLGISGSSLNLNNSTSNILIYNPVGVNPPTFTTRSIGTKLVLYNNLTATNMDYTIGIETNNMWFTSNIGFKWYTNNTSAALILNANGTVLNGNGNNCSYTINNGSAGFDLALASGSSNYSTSALAGDTILRTSVGHNLILQTNGGGAANIIINTSGNVGIGTSNPISTFQVNSTQAGYGIFSYSPTQDTGVILSGSNGLFGSIEAFNLANNTKRPLSLANYGGGVGIACTGGGGFSLDVSGTGRITSSLAIGNQISSVQQRPLTISSSNISFGSISVTNSGDARYHLYNGGANSEWLFGQKTTTRNDFSITGLNNGIEKDLLTILSPFGGNSGFVGISTSSPINNLTVQSISDIPAINPDAFNSLIICEDMQQSTLRSGITQGNSLSYSQYNTGGNGYIQLTALGTFQYGQYYWNINPGNSFTTIFDHLAGGGTGADEIGFYFHGTLVPSPTSTYGSPSNGYVVIFSEFNSNIQLVYNGTTLATTSVTDLGNNTWHTTTITFFRNNIRVMYDGKLLINYLDIINRDLTTTKSYMGFNGYSGGTTNFHRIRNIRIQKFTEGLFQFINPTSGNIINVAGGNIFTGNFTNSSPTKFTIIIDNPKLVISTGVNGFPATSGTVGNAIGLRIRGADDGVFDMGINSGNGAWLQSTNFVSGYNLNYPLLLNPNGGNVGINTTSPAFSLDVSGSVNISGTTLNMNGTNPAIIYNSSGVNPPTFTTRSIGTKIVLYSQITSTNLDYAIGIEGNSMWMSSQALFKFYTSNSLTAALIVSANGLSFNGNGNNSSYTINNGSAGFDLALAASSSSYSTSALAGDTILRTTVGHNLILQTNGGGAANIIINTSGNVGIGTSNPLYTFQVNSTQGGYGIFSYSPTQDTGVILSGSNGLFGSIEAFNLANNTKRPLSLANYGGGVGIGCTGGGGFSLDVSGTFRSSGVSILQTGSQGIFAVQQALSNYNTGPWLQNNSGLQIGWNNVSGTGGVDLLANEQAGGGPAFNFWYINSSNTTPSRISQINNAGQYSLVSDYRLKDKIVDLKDNNNFDKLRPVKYIYNRDNSEQIGFIAHEVQEIYPLLVNGEKDTKEYQTLNYTGLIPIMVMEIKKIIKQKETLLNNNELLTKAINELLTENKELKTDILLIKRMLNIPYKSQVPIETTSEILSEIIEKISKI